MMLQKAAKSTCSSPGKQNVSVWAGTQNNGNVFLNTKFHWVSQSNSLMSLRTGTGFSRLMALPS